MALVSTLHMTSGIVDALCGIDAGPRVSVRHHMVVKGDQEMDVGPRVPCQAAPAAADSVVFAAM